MAREDARAGQVPAWRQPMVWLMAGLPLAAVAAGLATLWIAIGSSGNNDVVPEKVTRSAQVQQADLGPDERARQLGLSLVLRLRGGRIELLPATGAFDRARPLQVALLHPTQAAQDRRIALAPDALGWGAAMPVDAAHDWRVEATPADGAWRLRGRLHAGEQATRLGPALAGD